MTGRGEGLCSEPGLCEAGAQSSLSERVSYCSDSREGQARCWATGGAPDDGGGCCCWLWSEGDAMEVGGVLLRMRMVRGLYGNCMEPVEEGRSSQFH